jgi:crotonobetainyl-CoA:carnitine CoA-transferase CaiB-like acyl-CoA transferase
VPGFQLADISGGMWCVIAIQAALAERQRTGQGAVLDVAMTDGVLGFNAMAVGMALAGHPVRRGDEPITGGIAPYQTYLSSDGHPIALAALEPKFWAAFCAGAGIDPDMTALIPGPHQAAIKERVAAVFAGKTREEWARFGAQHDCCVEPVLDPSEIARDPHLASRGLFFELPTPRGSVPQLRTPVTPKDERFAPPPRMGEHTRAILEEAGFASAEIDELVRVGAARE